MKPSCIETDQPPETPQSQLTHYALLVVSTVESLIETAETRVDPNCTPPTQAISSKRIRLITNCSNQIKEPWHATATEQPVSTPTGTITEWILKFDCSCTDLFSPTFTDEMKVITFTVTSDNTNKNIAKIKVETTEQEAVVISFQLDTNDQKRMQLLKWCKDILTPLVVELEKQRHRVAVKVALDQSLQKA